MDQNTQTLLISLLGILATLCVSVVGFYFTVRARADAMRALVYGKQLDVLIKISECISQAETLVSVLSTDPGAFIAEAADELRSVSSDLRKVDHIAAVLLPASLFAEFTETAQAIVALAVSAHGDQGISKECSTAIGCTCRFTKLARAHLGVDSLSKETLKVLGTRKSFGDLLKNPRSAT